MMNKEIINKIELDRTKPVNEPPSGYSNSSNLLVYLSDINADIIKESNGKEKIYKEVSENIIITKTAKGFFRTLYLNDKKEIVGCIHGLNKRNNRILQNIFVRRDYRRKGIRTELVSVVTNQFKGIQHSNNFTDEGYAFFNVKEKKHKLENERNQAYEGWN